MIKKEKEVRIFNTNLECRSIDDRMIIEGYAVVFESPATHGYTEIIEKKVERDPFEFKDIQRTEKLKLTDEQQSAYDAICDSMDDMLFSEFLIYGVTGSRQNWNLLAINRKST